MKTISTITLSEFTESEISLKRPIILTLGDDVEDLGDPELYDLGTVTDKDGHKRNSITIKPNVHVCLCGVVVFGEGNVPDPEHDIIRVRPSLLYRGLHIDPKIVTDHDGHVLLKTYNSSDYDITLANDSIIGNVTRFGFSS